MSVDHLPPPREVDRELLSSTIAATIEASFAQCAPDGRFVSPAHLGIAPTLQTMAMHHFLGTLDPEIAKRAATLVMKTQLPHGAFPNFLGDPAGDPWITGLAIAGLRLAGDPSFEEPIARARAYMARAGGDALAANGIYRCNLLSLYIAMAGELDPSALPELPVEGMFVHPVLDAMRTKACVQILWMGVAVWAIVRHLREPEKRASPSWLESIERKRALEIIGPFQNHPSGSFNANVFQTTLAVAAFHALGVPADDPRITGAVTWIHNTAQLHVDPDASQNLAFHGFRTGIWSTALLLRALFAAGVSRNEPRVVQSLRWLMDSQIHEDLPALVPTAPGAPRSGGWAFECRNPTTPDADDTAVVLGAFGLALQGQGTDVLDEQTATLVRASVDKGLAFLLGMQNPDGGWPAFQQGLTSKPRGPFLVSYPVFERGNLLQDLETALRNTPVFGDPATEDITGRTLFALAQHGYTRDSPVVQKAIAFLIAQQCTQEDLGGGASHEGGGPWWSRWISNYLVATSYVLGGLAAVGVDPQEPFIRRAVDWTLRQQNEDGGWGEEAASYQNPALAGQGASMPVTTAVVICGLIQIGEGRSDAVKRAVNYLLRVPREPSGMWPDPGPLHVFARTDQFYKFTGARLYYPLEALARYRALLDGAEPAVAVADRSAATTSRADALGSAVVADRPVRDAKGGWDVAALESLRTSGDPEADAVVRAIFEDGHLPAVNALMARIARNDDPVPQGLPPIAADYFERTAKLPEWAEPDKLARASRVFSSVGWATAFALYYGSLPQCYAGAKGARALIGTRSFIDFPEQRILETAQFIFDVASDGAFAEGGSGIRAPQKVRLLHAAIRRLTLEQATWDMEWGVPVNQEDAAATLMSFAVVIIDVWKKMGFDFSDEDNEAWLHLWKVVGHYLGVHPDLLPRDLADARALWEAITGAQWAPSDSGRALTRSLFGLADRLLPHYRGANLPPTLLRHFSGDRCADLLGAPPGDWTSVLLRGGAFVERLAGAPDHDSRVASLAHAVATDLMKGLVLVVREGKQTRFRIPPALLHDWNMND